MRRKSISITLLILLALACGRGKKDEQYKTEKVDRGGITMTVTATEVHDELDQVTAVVSVLHDLTRQVENERLYEALK